MTHLTDLRGELVVISGEPGPSSGKSGGFFEKRGDFLWTDEDIPIPIQLHYLPHKEGRPVLLLHGASAGADTFLAPGHGGRSFVDYLISENYEPWLLDWRASKDVAETIIKLRKGEAVDLGLPPKRAGEIRKQYASNGDEVFEQLNFNAAAENDIKRAVAAIRARRPGRPIDVVAHCMGAAITAEAITRKLEPFQALQDPDLKIAERVSHVVLSTIGLFYQMNFHGRLKAEAHLLKRVQGDGANSYRFLDPRVNTDKKKPDSTRPLPNPPWPEFFEVLYQTWNVPYSQERLEREGIPLRDRHVFEMFNRLSFMFGEPYQEGNLAPEFHHRLQAITIEPLKKDRPTLKIPAGSAIIVVDSNMEDPPMGEAAYDYESGRDNKLWVCRSNKDFAEGQLLSADGLLIGHVGPIDLVDDINGPLLPALFGPMSLDLFRHGAENLRAGMATTLNESKEDGKHDDEDSEPKPTPLFDGNDDDEDRASFEQLDRLTLVGGGLNRLWHRDCIDRMADWLDRSQVMREKCRKTILRDYGHQDLFWGRDSVEAVFPKIVDGLGSSSPEEGQENEEREEDYKDEQPNANPTA